MSKEILTFRNIDIESKNLLPLDSCLFKGRKY